MLRKTRRILSLVLSLGLLFQQIGFAQVATELNIANHLARMASSFTVDKFRPVHLRYFSYDSLTDNFKVLLDKGDVKNLRANELENSTKALLNYFLVGVTLPDSTFWVNLRPDSEDQVIDPYLEKTDVGKIMLEADLQLKKDTALYTSPQTPEGREYWNRLYKKAAEIFSNENIEIPTLTRPWIVPGEIIVRESKDSAYVYKATLKVMLGQDYLKDSTTYNFKDERSKALNEYSSQLIRELIIPKLTKEVNSAKRYAPLRQVYYSLILSRWFKLRFADPKGLSPNGTATEGSPESNRGIPNFIGLIDKQDLTNLASKEPWSKTDYFKQYQKSFSQGEYSIKEPVYTPTGQVIRSYFSGGENLTVLPINNGVAYDNRAFSHTVLTKTGTVFEGSAASPISLQPSQEQSSTSLKISTLDDLPPFLQGVFIVGNWDLPFPGLSTEKLVESIPTIKRAFEISDEVYFTSHFRRPSKEDWQNESTRGEFSLIKQVTPLARKLFQHEGIDAVIIELPHDFSIVPQALRAARKDYPGRKLFYLFENNRSYPFQSRYFLGSQPSAEEQMDFISAWRQLLPEKCAFVDEASASHETDATKKMGQLFSPEMRAAGIVFQDVMGKVLKFEAQSASGQRLFIMGGAKYDKVSEHLKEFLSDIGMAKSGDTFFIIGALAYAVMRSEGTEAGSSYKHKPKEQQAINAVWSQIKQAARQKEVNVFVTGDHRIEGLEGSHKEIRQDQVAIGPGDTTVEELISIIRKIRESGKGGIFFNGGGTSIKAEDALKDTDARIVEEISWTADAGIVVLFSGADTVALLDKLRSLGTYISPKCDISSAGGTILAGLAVGVSTLESIKSLLKEDTTQAAASPITSTASSTLYSLDTQLSRLDKFVNANRGKGSVKGIIEQIYASVYVFNSKTATYPSFGVGVTTREATGINEVSQSGTSSGSKEPITLSPKDSYQTEEKELFDSRIKPLLLGRNVADILRLDEELERIGRAAKPNPEAPDLIFGGPAITATSMALVRALARSAHIDEEVAGFWIYNQLAKAQGVHGLKEMTLPVPMAKVNDGGVHGITFIEEREVDGKIVKVKLPLLPYQEFLFTPIGYTDYFEALRALRDVTKRYYEIIRQEVDKNFKFGAEAAIQSNNLSSIVQVLGFMTRAIKETPNGQGVFIARDDAASELYNHPGKPGLYYLGEDGKEYAGSQDGYVTTQQKIEFDKMLNKRFPRIVSLEDGFSEDDRAGWIQGTRELRDRVLLIGDDVFVTAPEIVTDGVKDQVATAVLDKLNQAGTFSRAVLAHIIARILPAKLNQELPWLIATSHRSGEPAEQNMMAVLAVAAASEFIKTTYGSISGGGQGREAKVNYLSTTAEKWQDRGTPLKYVGARMLNNPQRGFEKIVKEYTEKGIYTEEDVNRMAASQVTQDKGAVSSAVAATTTMTADDLDRLMRGYPPLPAMLQLTAKLKAYGITMGIFTNAPESVLDKARSDFPNIFTDSNLMIRTVDVGQKKTETYAAIQQRVKRPVIIVEDERKFADAAAKAIGVQSILVNPDEPLTLKHPILLKLVASIQSGDAEIPVIFFDISGTLYNNTRPIVFRAVRGHIRRQLPPSFASSLNMEELFSDETLDDWLFTGVEAAKLRRQPQEITPEGFARTVERQINEKLQGGASSAVEVLGELKGTPGEDRKEIKIPDSVMSGAKKIVVYSIIPYAEPSEAMILVLGRDGIAESASNKFSFHEYKGTTMGTYSSTREKEGTLSLSYDREKRNLTLKVLQGIERESSFVVKLEPAARSAVARRDNSLKFAQYLESLLEDGTSEKRFNEYEVTSSFATQGGGIFRLDGGWQEAINSVPLSKITVSEILGTGDILVKRKTPAASSAVTAQDVVNNIIAGPAIQSGEEERILTEEQKGVIEKASPEELRVELVKVTGIIRFWELVPASLLRSAILVKAHLLSRLLQKAIADKSGWDNSASPKQGFSSAVKASPFTSQELSDLAGKLKIISYMPYESDSFRDEYNLSEGYMLVRLVFWQGEAEKTAIGFVNSSGSVLHRDLSGNWSEKSPEDIINELAKIVASEEKLASSPMQEAPPKTTGGIDFRALPMTIQPMGSFQGLNFKLPQLSQAELEKMDVAVEMQQIKNMLQAGIIPSGQRIKELIAACVQKG